MKPVSRSCFWKTEGKCILGLRTKPIQPINWNICHYWCLTICNRCSNGTEAQKHYFLSRVLLQDTTWYTAEVCGSRKGIPCGYRNVKIWGVYLHRKYFTIYTDHCHFCYLQTQKSLSQRQVRWLEAILSFTFTILPTRENTDTVPDALSR